MKSIVLPLVAGFTIIASDISTANDRASTLGPLDCVVQPSEVVDVGAAVSGLITSINVDRSDTVQKSDVIFKLESSVEAVDAKLSSMQAKTDTAIQLRTAALELGYKTKQRNARLRREALIAEQEIDQLDTDIRIAELNLALEVENQNIAKLAQKRANAVLERRKVRSPISGVVVERYKSSGERVDDDPVLRIAQLDPLHIEAVVPVEHFDALSTGMQATVRPRIQNSESYRATVERIDQVMDPASGTFGVRLSLPNPNYSIPAGVLCSLDLIPNN